MTKTCCVRARYEALGRLDEYGAWVAKLNGERAQFLQQFPDLDPAIVKGLGVR